MVRKLESLLRHARRSLQYGPVQPTVSHIYFPRSAAPPVSRGKTPPDALGSRELSATTAIQKWLKRWLRVPYCCTRPPQVDRRRPTRSIMRGDGVSPQQPQMWRPPAGYKFRRLCPRP